MRHEIERARVHNESLNLRPVVIDESGKEHTGEFGERHKDVIDRLSVTSESDRGFRTPDGMLLDREAALRWVKLHQPDVFNRLAKAGVKELYTEAYMAAIRGEEVPKPPVSGTKEMAPTAKAEEIPLPEQFIKGQLMKAGERREFVNKLSHTEAYNLWLQKGLDKAPEITPRNMEEVTESGEAERYGRAITSNPREIRKIYEQFKDESPKITAERRRIEEIAEKKEQNQAYTAWEIRRTKNQLRQEVLSTALGKKLMTPEEITAHFEAGGGVSSEQRLAETAWQSGRERPFAYDPNSTVNEGRFRLVSPDDIKRGTYFRRKSTTPGVSYIMGKDESGKTVTQAIRFDKRVMTEDQARQWWETNKDRFRRPEAAPAAPVVPTAPAAAEPAPAPPAAAEPAPTAAAEVPTVEQETIGFKPAGKTAGRALPPRTPA